jgi:hypothetical protein
MQARRIALLVLLCLALSCCVACTRKESGTEPPTSSAGTRAKQVTTEFDRSRILRLRAVLKDREGNHLTGVVGVLFAIYEQKEGGAPLWQEVQNIEAGERGRFTALVGSTTSEGIPPELFTTEKARWLGKQVLLPGEVEQPRIRLVSTPYGLRAESAVRPVTAQKSGDQSAMAEAQKAAGEAGRTRENPSGPPRARRRLHPQPMP